MVQRCHGRATDGHGGHLQRRHRTEDIQHTNRGHRRLHVHREKWRGTDQPHRPGADSRWCRDHVAADQPDEARGRESGVHVRGKGHARQRDGPVVSRRLIRQVHLVAGDQSDHKKRRFHGNKSGQRRRLGPVSMRSQQRHRRSSVRVRLFER